MEKYRDRMAKKKAQDERREARNARRVTNSQSAIKERKKDKAGGKRVAARQQVEVPNEAQRQRVTPARRTERETEMATGVNHGAIGLFEDDYEATMLLLGGK